MLRLRLPVLLAGAAASLLAGAPAAAAAPPRVLLGATPAEVEPGSPVRVTLRVVPATAGRPLVTAAAPGRAARRVALTAAGSGRFRATLRLPAGRWTLSARLAGRSARLRVVPVVAPPALAGAARLARTCRSDAIPFQQGALAVLDGAAWVACRDDRTVVRVDGSGRVTARVSVSPLHPWAVAAGAGAIWVIDRDRAQADRIDAARATVTARISLPDAPVAVWAGTGGAWFALDGHGSVVRVDAASNTVAAEIPTGDGPSSFTSDGHLVYVTNHRDRSLAAIDPATDQARVVARELGPAESAPERVAWAAGALWVTGRGLPLLRVDPSDGRVTAEVAIGPAGMDVVAGDRVWVAAYDAVGARRGDPDAGELLEVDPASGAVVAHHAASGLSVGGLAAVGPRAWVVDARHGALLATPG